MLQFCSSEFWDTNLTWYTNEPYFTSCFENTVVPIIPTIFLVLFAHIDIINIIKSQKLRSLSLNKLPIIFVIKSFMNITLIAVYVIELIGTLVQQVKVEYLEQYISTSVTLLGYVGIFVLFLLSYKKGVDNSGVGFIFWFISVLTHAILFRTAYNKPYELYVFSKKERINLLRIISFPILSLRLIFEIFSPLFEITKNGKVSPNSRDCPDKTTSFLSKIFFCWFDKLAFKGYRSTLAVTDLWNQHPEDKAKFQYDQIKIFLKDTNLTSTSLTYQILKTYGLKWFWAGILKISGSVLVFAQPVLLKRLIDHIDDPAEPLWKGVFYSILLASSCLLQSLMVTYSDKRAQVIGMRMKSAVYNAIYRKSLVLSLESRNGTSVGEMMNLMNVDVQKFMDLITIHNALPSPFIIGFSIYFLYDALHMSAFVGFGILIVFVISINVITGKLGSALQNRLMKLKDKRLQLITEMIESIKFIKFYTWEPYFLNRVQEIRKGEMKYVCKLQILQSLSSVMYQTFPFLLIFAMFVYYTISYPNESLNGGKIFVVINLINTLKQPMTTVPAAATAMMQLYVSIKRLSNFFRLSEKQTLEQFECNPSGYRISINAGVFLWDDNTPTLQNINLRIKTGELVGIVGRIGSGKSSLFSAILGEMKKETGGLCVDGQISYAPQEAWIRNDTLRGNILLGSEFDPKKYSKVIQACELEADIQQLPSGDKTEIGEKGANLSGGQKQRVSLARALYQDNPILLFDDPLSALDASVAANVFQKGIGPHSITRNKTRVIITHSTKYLPLLNRVIFMDNGRIQEEGTYTQLMETKGELWKFLLEEGKESIETANISSSTSNLLQHHDKHDKLMSHNQSDFKLTEKEYLVEGNTRLDYYIQYFTSSGPFFLIISFMLYMLYVGACLYYNFYLESWSNYETSYAKLLAVESSYKNTSRENYLTGYAIIGFTHGTVYTFAVLTSTIIGLSASRKFHTKALKRILRAPLNYFERIPTGILLNRFSRDIEVLDNVLPSNVPYLFVLLVSTIVAFTIVCTTSPILITCILPLLLIYAVFQRFYVTSSRQLRRLESISRSPIYSHFNETMAGLSSIQAFGLQEMFISEAEDKIDQNQKIQYPFLISSLWMALRLKILGTLTVLCTTLSVVITKKTIDPGSAGLAITVALSLTTLINLLATQMGDFENNVVSIERLGELLEVEEEADWTIQGNCPDNWPTAGKITFENYWATYHKGLPPALKGLCFTIEEGEKLGIIGRTGSGKSSITLALFRILEALKGRILIDSVDISTLGLHDLRRVITIIPQDPVLLSTTIRENLDPNGLYSDGEIWNALEGAHLKEVVLNLKEGLHHLVLENGKHFSVGERQLLCLSRALLRKTKILVLDEATSNVDPETDKLIQSTVDKEFSKSTKIVIAHRIKSIINSDRIIVMKNGTMEVMDSPENLGKMGYSIINN